VLKKPSSMQYGGGVNSWKQMKRVATWYVTALLWGGGSRKGSWAGSNGGGRVLVMLAGVLLQQEGVSASSTNIPTIHDKDISDDEVHFSASIHNRDPTVSSGSSTTGATPAASTTSGFQSGDDKHWVQLSTVQLEILQAIGGFFLESKDFTADLLWEKRQPGEGGHDYAQHHRGKVEELAGKRDTHATSSAIHSETAGEWKGKDRGHIVHNHVSEKRPTFEDPDESVGLVVDWNHNGGAHDFGKSRESMQPISTSSVENVKRAAIPSQLTQRRMVTVVSDETALNNALSNFAEIKLAAHIMLTAPIAISGLTGVVINGNGFKVDGNNAVRCFKVEVGAEVFFFNLTITNGNTNSEVCNFCVHVSDTILTAIFFFLLPKETCGHKYKSRTSNPPTTARLLTPFFVCIFPSDQLVRRWPENSGRHCGHDDLLHHLGQCCCKCFSSCFRVNLNFFVTATFVTACPPPPHTYFIDNPAPFLIVHHDTPFSCFVPHQNNGGGLYASQATIMMTSCFFLENTAVSDLHAILK
jgi:hypothetical protein